LFVLFSVNLLYYFLILAQSSERGVYEISVRSMNIDDRRPTSGPIHTFRKISNAHNSAMHHLIDFMFSDGNKTKILRSPRPRL